MFIQTNRFQVQDKQYAKSITLPLRLPTSDTLRIVGAALMGLEPIFQPAYLYAKAGVMLLDLKADTMAQQELDLRDREVLHEQRYAKRWLRFRIGLARRQYGWARPWRQWCIRTSVGGA